MGFTLNLDPRYRFFRPDHRIRFLAELPSPHRISDQLDRIERKYKIFDYYESRGGQRGTLCEGAPLTLIETDKTYFGKYLKNDVHTKILFETNWTDMTVHESITRTSTKSCGDINNEHIAIMSVKTQYSECDKTFGEPLTEVIDNHENIEDYEDLMQMRSEVVLITTLKNLDHKDKTESERYSLALYPEFRDRDPEDYWDLYRALNDQQDHLKDSLVVRKAMRNAGVIHDEGLAEQIEVLKEGLAYTRRDIVETYEAKDLLIDDQRWYQNLLRPRAEVLKLPDKNDIWPSFLKVQFEVLNLPDKYEILPLFFKTRMNAFIENIKTLYTTTDINICQPIKKWWGQAEHIEVLNRPIFSNADKDPFVQIERCYKRILNNRVFIEADKTKNIDKVEVAVISSEDKGSLIIPNDFDLLHVLDVEDSIDYKIWTFFFLDKIIIKTIVYLHNSSSFSFLYCCVFIKIFSYIIVSDIVYLKVKAFDDYMKQSINLNYYFWYRNQIIEYTKEVKKVRSFLSYSSVYWDIRTESFIRLLETLWEFILKKIAGGFKVDDLVTDPFSANMLEFKVSPTITDDLCTTIHGIINVLITIFS